MSGFQKSVQDIIGSVICPSIHSVTLSRLYWRISLFIQLLFIDSVTFTCLVRKKQPYYVSPSKVNSLHQPLRHAKELSARENTSTREGEIIYPARSFVSHWRTKKERTAEVKISQEWKATYLQKGDPQLKQSLHKSGKTRILETAVSLRALS